MVEAAEVYTTSNTHLHHVHTYTHTCTKREGDKSLLTKEQKPEEKGEKGENKVLVIKLYMYVCMYV